MEIKASILRGGCFSYQLERPGEMDTSEVAYASEQRLEGGREGLLRQSGKNVADSASLPHKQTPEFGQELHYWSVEPNVGRVAHGVPSRVDRLRALGNAVVPQVAEWIGRLIVEAHG